MESSGRTNFSLIKLEGMMLLVSPECSQCSPALQKSSSPCRLWWCPTGPFSFLPIHAAGIYDTKGTESVFDYVVSSYTPSLKSLLSDHPPINEQFKVAVVIQPDTPSENPSRCPKRSFKTSKSMSPALFWAGLVSRIILRLYGKFYSTCQGAT